MNGTAAELVPLTNVAAPNPPVVPVVPVIDGITAAEVPLFLTG